MHAYLYLQLIACFTNFAFAAPRSVHGKPISRHHNTSGLEHDLESVVSSDAGVYALGTTEFDIDGLRYTNYDRPTFAITVEPAVEEDVSAVIDYAVAHEIPFFVQGGGHGYSTTLSIVQDAIQISLKRFNTASVDAEGSLTIGGATTFGTMINATYAAGRVLTTGSSVCVGAVGATLGGGHGPLQGKYGLSLDALTSLRVVLANGSIVTTSSTENTDLWYAMRGAGPSFGAVVTATYKTYPQENDGKILDVEWSFALDKTDEVFTLVDTVGKNISENLGLFVLIGVNATTEKPSVFIVFEWTGPEDEASTYLAQFRDIGPSTESYALREWNVLGYEIVNGVFSTCTKNLTSITYSANLATLDLSTVNSLISNLEDFIAKYPAANNIQMLFEVFGQAAALAVPEEASAYGTRRFDKILTLITITFTDLSLSDVIDEWAKAQRDLLFSTSGYDKDHVYMNYAHGDEGLHAIYGYDSERINKLQRIKSKYDPKDVFNGYHDIPLLGAY